MDSGHTHCLKIFINKCVQVSDSSQNDTMQMRRGGAGAGSANQEAAGRQCRPIRGQNRLGTMRTRAPTLSTYLVDYLYFILAQALPLLLHAQSLAIRLREKIFLEKEKRRAE